MGTTSKVISMVLRAVEWISAIICVSLLGYFIHRVDMIDGPLNSRITYGMVMACLSLFFSIVLFIPARYSFYCFPIDLILFVCDIVAFGLLTDLTGTHSCSAFWYWNYWGYYWGSFWVVGPRNTVTAVDVGHAGCGAWRSTIAFMFIMGFCFLWSGFLGMYAVSEIYGRRSEPGARVDGTHENEKWGRRGSREAETPVTNTTNTYPPNTTNTYPTESV